MSGIGAELPPHLLAKRKRQQEEQAQDEPPIASGAKRSPSPEGADKRRRVIGPAMPPAPLEERPTEPAIAQPQEDESSSDDDDFGPSLPPTGAEAQDDGPSTTRQEYTSEAQAEPAKPKRDDWMTMPPEQDGLASRMDPSKLRARGFNTGKGAKAPAEKGGDSSAWHETPEQKRKRLEDEMMGVSRPTPGVPKAAGPSKKSGDDVEARALKERTVRVLKAIDWRMRSDTDSFYRTKLEDLRLWNNTKAGNLNTRKTTPAHEHSTVKKTWVWVALAAPRRKNFSSKLAASRPNSLVAASSSIGHDYEFDKAVIMNIQRYWIVTINMSRSWHTLHEDRRVVIHLQLIAARDMVQLF